MACLKTSKNDSMMGPRISFSSDFLDLQDPIKLENSYREAPVSSDFAFSAPYDDMISADELFSNGKMLPLRKNCKKTPTLRDELLAGDEDCEAVGSSRMVKESRHWKQRLGLKKLQSKKGERNHNHGGLQRIDEIKSSEIVF